MPVEQDYEESLIECDDSEPHIADSPSPVNVKMAHLAYAPQNQHERMQEYDQTCNFMIVDNQMDESTISILNNPIALSKTLKEQFDKAVQDKHKKLNGTSIVNASFNLEPDEYKIDTNSSIF